MGVTSSSLLTVLTLAQTKVLNEVVIERLHPFGGILLLLLLQIVSRSFRLQCSLFAIILVNHNVITFVSLFSFCCCSSLDAGNLGPPFFSNVFEDLASMCRFLIVWGIWPLWQSECGLCFRGPSVVHQQHIPSSPVWLPWFNFPAGNVGLSYSTLFDMSFDSPPLVRSTATTDGTH